eukprot:m.82260 g.82260  ORF g.82260 m.82260 type:complete len:1753 (-) comp8664_c0_seq1:716-5974(-)
MMMVLRVTVFVVLMVLAIGTSFMPSHTEAQDASNCGGCLLGVRSKIEKQFQHANANKVYKNVSFDEIYNDGDGVTFTLPPLSTLSIVMEFLPRIAPTGYSFFLSGDKPNAWTIDGLNMDFETWERLHFVTSFSKTSFDICNRAVYSTLRLKLFNTQTMEKIMTISKFLFLQPNCPLVASDANNLIITSIHPQIVQEGSYITIRGNQHLSDPTQVTMSNMALQLTIVQSSKTEVIVRMPTKIANKEILTYSLDMTLNFDLGNFTIKKAVQFKTTTKIISSFPDNAPVGTIITITGQNFNQLGDNILVYVGETVATVISSSVSTILFQLVADPVPDLVITGDAGTYLTCSSCISIAPNPILASTSVNFRHIGSTEVQGENLAWDTAKVEGVWVGSQAVLNYTFTSTSLVIYTLRGPPTQSTSFLLVKWSNGQSVSATLASQHILLSLPLSSFKVPPLTSFSTSGISSSSTILSVSLGGSLCVQAIGFISFNCPEKSTINSNLVVNFADNLQAVEYDVFTIGPSISSISPQQAAPGFVVNIEGKNFGNLSASSGIEIAGVLCTFVNITDNLITARLEHPTVFPNAFGVGPTGPVIIRANAISSSALVSLFDFQFLQPRISGLSHTTLYGSGIVYLKGSYLQSSSSQLAVQLDGILVPTTSSTSSIIGIFIDPKSQGFHTSDWSSKKNTISILWDDIVVSMFETHLVWNPPTTSHVVLLEGILYCSGSGFPSSLSATLLLKNDISVENYTLPSIDRFEEALIMFNATNNIIGDGLYQGFLVFDDAFFLLISSVNFTVSQGSITPEVVNIYGDETMMSSSTFKIDTISPSLVLEGQIITITVSGVNLEQLNDITVKVGSLQGFASNTSLTSLLNLAKRIQNVDVLAVTSRTLTVKIPSPEIEGTRLLVVVSSALFTVYSTEVSYNSQPSIIEITPSKWEVGDTIRITLSANVKALEASEVMFFDQVYPIVAKQGDANRLFVNATLSGTLVHYKNVKITLKPGIIVRIVPSLEEVCFCESVVEFGLSWNAVLGCESLSRIRCSSKSDQFAVRRCTNSDRFGAQDTSRCENEGLKALALTEIRKDNIDSSLSDFSQIVADSVLSGVDVRHGIQLLKSCTRLLTSERGLLPRRTYSMVFGSVSSMLNIDQYVLKNATDANTTVRSTTLLMEEWSLGLSRILNDDEASMYTDDNLVIATLKFGRPQNNWDGIANVANKECNESCTIDESKIQTNQLGQSKMKYSLNGSKPLRSIAIVVLANSILFAESAVNNLQTNETVVGENATFINSPVLSIQVEHDDGSNVFEGTVEFDLPLIVFERVEEALCSFWIEKWETFGCEVVGYDNVTVTCRCTHLTNFALLVKKTSGEGTSAASAAHNEALSYISYVGLGLSSVLLLFTMMLFVFHKQLRRDLSRNVLSHLCFTLVVAILIFLFGFERKSSMGSRGCIAIGALLHYFLLSAFCWMLVEGYLFYIRFAVVFVQHKLSDTQKHIRFMAFAYLCPIVLVAITLGSFTPGTYESEDTCWLDYTNRSIWMFIGPVIVVVIINMFFFFKIIHAVVDIQSKHNSDAKENAKQAVRASATFMCVMGLTWILSAFSLNIVLQYVFVILNAFQGVLIFLFHCLLNRAVRDILSGKRRRETVRRAKSTGAQYSSTRGSKNTLLSASISTKNQSFVSNSFVEESINEELFGNDSLEVSTDPLQPRAKKDSLLDGDNPLSRKMSMQLWIQETVSSADQGDGEKILALEENSIDTEDTGYMVVEE